MANLSPIHPGEILKEEFLEPMGLSAYKLSKASGLPQTRLSAIIHKKRSITPDTAIRLGKALGTTPEFWLNLQSFHDLRVVQASSSPADNVRRLVAA